MNRKQLVILLVAGLIIGSFGFIAYQRKTQSFKSSDSSLGQKLLPDFPVNEVAQIQVKQGTNELNLVKQNEVWKVRERNLYPADFGAISEFLRKVWELKTVQNVKVGPSQFSRLELPSPGQPNNSSTLVDFKDAQGKTLRSLVLGKKYLRESGNSSPSSPLGGGGGDWPAGRFVMVPDAGAPKVWLISEPLANVEPKPEQWVNKDFLHLEKIRAVSVVTTNATNNWKLSRETETAEWKLADKGETEELDAAKTGAFGHLLSSATFNDVLPPDTKPEVTGLGQPVTATVETMDNLVYRLNLGRTSTNEENFHVTVNVSGEVPAERTPGKEEKPEDKAKLDKEHKERIEKVKEKLAKEKQLENWIFVVSKWTVDPLLKPRHELLAEKKEEKKDPDLSAPVPLPVPGEVNPNPAPAPEEAKKPAPGPEPKKPE